ncbi:MAG: hypothetical protein R3332_05995 [Pseudohongiellaceae bacterium]|nr:hypothetical protein [Pseudohongiellaceae bacterium]
MPVKSKVPAKTIPKAKAKVTPAKPSSPPPEPYNAIRSGTCSSLNGLNTLTYEVGIDTRDAYAYRITANTGGGFFSPEWIDWGLIELTLNPIDQITSFNLRKLFQGQSANNAGFLVAILRAEGLLGPYPAKKRYYRLTGHKPSRTPPIDTTPIPSENRQKDSRDKPATAKKPNKK